MAKDEDEEVACPVCGKNVGLEVPSCPHCGAEFEEEEEAPSAVVAKPLSADEEEEVACPVCGFLVGLELTSCPRCGAEFEEEEIEEVIEVEEKVVFEEVAPVPAKPKPAEKPKARPAEKPRARPAEKPKPKPKAREKPAGESPFADLPATVMDLRVLGLALIILGIVGTQVALMIDWYWSWVPPIEDNLGMFVAIPVLLLVIGLLVFGIVKKAVYAGREMPGMAPGTAMALFVFGILALVVVVLWDPINSALQDSKATVAVGFIAALVVGVLLLVAGMRSASTRAACR